MIGRHVCVADVEVLGHGFLDGIDADLAAGLFADEVAQQVFDFLDADVSAGERRVDCHAHQSALDAADVNA